jgi:menaquinone-dependent protoporphyrinogen IX oxidase
LDSTDGEEKYAVTMRLMGRNRLPKVANVFAGSLGWRHFGVVQRMLVKATGARIVSEHSLEEWSL